MRSFYKVSVVFLTYLFEESHIEKIYFTLHVSDQILVLFRWQVV